MPKNSISFELYVTRRHRTSNIDRKFVLDLKRNASFPIIKSWSEFRSYLICREDSHEALLAGRAVWRSYRNYIDAHA